MTHSVITESFMFLTALLTGGGAAVIYAALFPLRNKGRIFTVFADLIFSVCALTLLFITIQKTCGGDVRIYQIAGFIFGFFIFNAVLSRLTQFLTSITNKQKST